MSTRIALPVLALFAAPAVADSIFQGLGLPPGGTLASYALAISPDGSTVVGSAGFVPVTYSYGEWFMTWTAAQGAAFYSTPWQGAGSVGAVGISSTGAIVGCYTNYRTPTMFYGLGFPAGHPSSPFTISAAGDFIVGTEAPYNSGGAFRWSASTGYQLLGGDTESAAKDISANGSLVVGGSIRLGGGFTWTPISGFALVGGLPGAPLDDSDLCAVAADGSLAAGWAYNASGLRQPIRWFSGRGLRAIANLAGSSEGAAWDTSAHGDVIVGSAWTTPSGLERAFVWDRVRGTRDLKTYLLQLGSTDVPLWTLKSATAISADGRTIAGWGLNPQGRPEGFIAHIPAFCYANCDLSTTQPTLNINDFSCFLNRFAAHDPYANCDDSTTPPGLNILDFTCFLNQIVAGCP